MNRQTSFLLLLLSSLQWAKGHRIDIENEKELRKISEKVSRGNTFKGVTIFLQNDISMGNGPFEPIGNKDHGFMGTFDGQGHKISNLNINITEEGRTTVGLFGSTSDSSIENIILDSTCRITVTVTNTSETKDTIYVGGIAGFMVTNKSPVSITNCINMATITVKGSDYENWSISVGGILGSLVTYGEEAQIKNCGNIGSIFFSSFSSSFYYDNDGPEENIFAGGILGLGIGVGNLSKVEITNCMNTGNINGANYYTNGQNQSIGGIAGKTVHGYFSNCINLGDLSFNGNSLIGELAGHTSRTDGKYCYCKNNSHSPEGKFEENRTIDCSFFNDSFILNENTNVRTYTGNSLIDALNAFSDMHNINRWILNKGKWSVTFSITSNNNIRLNVIFNSALILRPRVADEGNYHFYGWYRNENLTEEFNENKTNGNIILYGKYEYCTDIFTLTYNVTVNICNVTEVEFGKLVDLPHKTSENETIGMWTDEFGEKVEWKFTMPARSITLYANLINTTIKRKEDLINFLEEVNSGMSCDGITIYLGNDIDMNGTELKPIGIIGNSFEGTFDGRGHIIKNFTINSTHLHEGFFGYSSTGMTIRNVVFADSCKVIGREYPDKVVARLIYKTSFGGVIGYCTPKKRECLMDNVISTGRVELEGDFLSTSMYIGGLVGSFGTGSFHSVIRNSAFLGIVSTSEISNKKSGTAYIGGIVGSVIGAPGLEGWKVENNLYAGRINVNESFSEIVYVGGISGGVSENSVIRNCVNIGSIDISDYENVTTGRITGFIEDSKMSYCYWEENSVPNFEYGEKKDSEIKYTSDFDSANFNLVSKVSIEDSRKEVIYNGYSLVEALNAFVKLDNKLSRWTANLNKNNLSFNVSGSKANYPISKLVLLPTFASDSSQTFQGWFKYKNMTFLFTNHYIREETILYGRWENTQPNYTVKFVSKEEVVEEKIVGIGNVVKTNDVNPKTAGYEFMGWVDEYGKRVTDEYNMPNRTLTLTALWLKGKLKTVEDLKEFSINVNKGVDCKGKTIQLMNDINMSGIEGFEPIGTNEHPFRGTFEGHGHTIRNLNITTSAKYSGLFGNVFDGTVKNLFLDESCIINCDYSFGFGCVGGAIGYCGAEKNNCTVVNVVNNGTVKFSGNNNETIINIGGIIGFCKAFEKDCIIDNCANHGRVEHNGSSKTIEIGGIVGCGSGESYEAVCKIWNSLNDGNITCSNGATQTELNIGGIVGLCDRNNKVGGCVSVGKIEVNETTFHTFNGGSISGKKDSTSEVRENIWSWDINYGDYDSENLIITNMNNMTLDNGTQVVDFLKGTTMSRTIPKQEKTGEYKTTWVINKYNKSVKVRVGKRVDEKYSSKIVLLPTFIDSNTHYFTGWKWKGKQNGAVDLRDDDKDPVFKGEWKKYHDGLYYVKLTSGPVAVVVVVGIFAFLYTRGYISRKKKINEIRNFLYPKESEADKPKTTLETLSDLYSDDYNPPEMKKALTNAGLKEENVDKCIKHAEDLEKDKKLPKELTVNDAAAIAMFIFEFEDENSPFKIINHALENKIKEEMDKIRDLLYFVMTALRKLPVVTGKDLYMGTPKDDSEDGFQSAKSSSSSKDSPSPEIWEGFSLVTSNKEEAKKSLKKSPETEKVSGTIFTIKNGWGYDISLYSLNNNENEILLEPERQFEVVIDVQSTEFNDTELSMLKTYPVLTKIYGEHNFKVSPIYFVEEFLEKIKEWKDKRRKEKRGDVNENNTGVKIPLLESNNNLPK